MQTAGLIDTFSDHYTLRARSRASGKLQCSSELHAGKTTKRRVES